MATTEDMFSLYRPAQLEFPERSALANRVNALGPIASINTPGKAAHLAQEFLAAFLLGGYGPLGQARQSYAETCEYLINTEKLPGWAVDKALSAVVDGKFPYAQLFNAAATRAIDLGFEFRIPSTPNDLPKLRALLLERPSEYYRALGFLLEKCLGTGMVHPEAIFPEFPDGFFAKDDDDDEPGAPMF
jgi:hypothetical protein